MKSDAQKKKKKKKKIPLVIQTEWTKIRHNVSSINPIRLLIVFFPTIFIIFRSLFPFFSSFHFCKFLYSFFSIASIFSHYITKYYFLSFFLSLFLFYFSFFLQFFFFFLLNFHLLLFHSFSLRRQNILSTRKIFHTHSKFTLNKGSPTFINISIKFIQETRCVDETRDNYWTSVWAASSIGKRILSYFRKHDLLPLSINNSVSTVMSIEYNVSDENVA